MKICTPLHGEPKMVTTRLQTITQNAFALPKAATANEAHVGEAILHYEHSDGHRSRMPKVPDRSVIERQGLRRLAEVEVLKFLRSCPDGISTQRAMQDGLTGIVRPASVENALRNLNGAAGFIRKHVSSTGNRNWYELTAKGRRA